MCDRWKKNCHTPSKSGGLSPPDAESGDDAYNTWTVPTAGKMIFRYLLTSRSHTCGPYIPSSPATRDVVHFYPHQLIFPHPAPFPGVACSLPGKGRVAQNPTGSYPIL